MCAGARNGKIVAVWSLVLLFAMVTTTLRSGICQKTCDATEFDAERLLFRKPGGAQTGEAYSTDQQLRAEVYDQLAMASRSLRGHYRGAALPAYRWYDRFMIKLIMKRYSGGETDTRKEVVYTDWEQVANFAEKSPI